MDATKTGVRNRIHSVKPRRRQVTFGTFGFASEHFAIESDQPFPISGDQIGVHIFRADRHAFLLDRAYKYHNRSSDVILREVSNFWSFRESLRWKKLRCFALLNMTEGRIG